MLRRPRIHEEVLVPFTAAAADAVAPATDFRSTWLSSSLRSIKARNLLDTYRTYLPPEFHDAVLVSVAGVWLPIRVAVAHYRACDALELPSTEIVEIGREATKHVHGTVLATFVKLAKTAGVTPWTVLTRLPDLWNRIWRGGGVSVVKLGPKEARIEIAGWPCAASPYCRTALRGVIPAVIDLFCTRSYARELPDYASDTSLAYVLSWA